MCFQNHNRYVYKQNKLDPPDLRSSIMIYIHILLLAFPLFLFHFRATSGTAHNCCRPTGIFKWPPIFYSYVSLCREIRKCMSHLRITTERQMPGSESTVLVRICTLVLCSFFRHGRCTLETADFHCRGTRVGQVGSRSPPWREPGASYEAFHPSFLLMVPLKRHGSSMWIAG